MILVKSAPFVSAFIDAVDEAIRQDHPHYGLSAIQRMARLLSHRHPLLSTL
jgi:hypothetical protein